MLISIIIPAYNEARAVVKSLDLIRKQMPAICLDIAQRVDVSQDHSFEVIIVNDGSGDRTGEIVRDYLTAAPELDWQLLEFVTNQGKGFAIKAGVMVARGKYVAFMDMDLSTPLEELPRLIMALQREKSIAIGSRGLSQSQIIKHQPFYRELMGKAFNLFVRWMVIDHLQDTQCGFKVFKNYDAKRIFSCLQTGHFGFDVEILFIAQELGLRIWEIPIAWHNSEHSSVSPLRDSWLMFTSLLWMKYRVRRYLRQSQQGCDMAMSIETVKQNL
ncbi:MAG: glycosyltransferase family 2 protein [Pseudanabaenaceae cyanobacterium bins.39]|nr:glycosyltransferase family 2 protein [Pseudanabaenaceae cyanobacterium bins.39]